MKKLTYKHTVRACYLGYITQAIGNNFSPLLFVMFHDSLGIPTGKITVLIAVNFALQLLVDLLAARFVDRIGYRRAVVAAHIFSAVGIAGLGIFPFVFGDAFSGLLAAVLCYAVGGGLIEVLISPIVEACPSDDKASAMSMLHSFYCWPSSLLYSSRPFRSLSSECHAGACSPRAGLPSRRRRRSSSRRCRYARSPRRRAVRA